MALLHFLLLLFVPGPLFGQGLVAGLALEDAATAPDECGGHRLEEDAFGWGDDRGLGAFLNFKFAAEAAGDDHLAFDREVNHFRLCCYIHSQILPKFQSKARTILLEVIHRGVGSLASRPRCPCGRPPMPPTVCIRVFPLAIQVAGHRSPPTGHWRHAASGTGPARQFYFVFLTPTWLKLIGLKPSLRAGEPRLSRKSTFWGETNCGSAMMEWTSCPRWRHASKVAPAKGIAFGVLSGRASQ